MLGRLRFGALLSPGLTWLAALPAVAVAQAYHREELRFLATAAVPVGIVF